MTAESPDGGSEDDLSDVGALPVTGVHDSPKQYEPYWKRIGQSLSEDDLKSGAVMKMLVNEAHRLSEENAELRGLRTEYYKADKNVAVLKATQGQTSELSTLSNFLIALGGVIAGIGGSLALSNQFLLGGILLVGGVMCMAMPHLIQRKSK